MEVAALSVAVPPSAWTVGPARPASARAAGAVVAESARPAWSVVAESARPAGAAGRRTARATRAVLAGPTRAVLAGPARATGSTRAVAAGPTGPTWATGWGTGGSAWIMRPWGLRRQRRSGVRDVDPHPDRRRAHGAGQRQTADHFFQFHGRYLSARNPVDIRPQRFLRLSTLGIG